MYRFNKLKNNLRCNFYNILHNLFFYNTLSMQQQVFDDFQNVSKCYIVCYSYTLGVNRTYAKLLNWFNIIYYA